MELVHFKTVHKRRLAYYNSETVNGACSTACSTDWLRQLDSELNDLISRCAVEPLLTHSITQSLRVPYSWSRSYMASIRAQRDIMGIDHQRKPCGSYMPVQCSPHTTQSNLIWQQSQCKDKSDTPKSKTNYQYKSDYAHNFINKRLQRIFFKFPQMQHLNKYMSQEKRTCENATQLTRMSTSIW